MTAYGIILAVPVFLAVIVMCWFKIGMLLSVLIPLTTIAGTLLILPLGLGNPEVVTLVRNLAPAAGVEDTAFVVQLTLVPRIRTGWRALLEDADDIGYLSLAGNELVFHGDSVRLKVSGEQVTEVRRQNIGLRGMFVYGPRIEVTIPGVAKFESLEFAERASWWLPGSRRLSNQIYQQLSLLASRSKQTPSPAAPSKPV